LPFSESPTESTFAFLLFLVLVAVCFLLVTSSVVFDFLVIVFSLAFSVALDARPLVRDLFNVSEIKTGTVQLLRNLLESKHAI
jgi:hypothetical protein